MTNREKFIATFGSEASLDNLGKEWLDKEYTEPDTVEVGCYRQLVAEMRPDVNVLARRMLCKIEGEDEQPYSPKELIGHLKGRTPKFVPRKDSFIDDIVDQHVVDYVKAEYEASLLQLHQQAAVKETVDISVGTNADFDYYKLGNDIYSYDGLPDLIKKVGNRNVNFVKGNDASDGYRPVSDKFLGRMASRYDETAIYLGLGEQTVQWMIDNSNTETVDIGVWAGSNRDYFKLNGKAYDLANVSDLVKAVGNRKVNFVKGKNVFADKIVRDGFFKDMASHYNDVAVDLGFGEQTAQWMADNVTKEPSLDMSLLDGIPTTGAEAGIQM